jgi:hypothetical protein
VLRGGICGGSDRSVWVGIVGVSGNREEVMGGRWSKGLDGRRGRRKCI